VTRWRYRPLAGRGRVKTKIDHTFYHAQRGWRGVREPWRRLGRSRYRRYVRMSLLLVSLEGALGALLAGADASPTRGGRVRELSRRVAARHVKV